MTETPLDRAHAAMEAAPEDDGYSVQHVVATGFE